MEFAKKQNQSSQPLSFGSLRKIFLSTAVVNCKQMWTQNVKEKILLLLGSYTMHDFCEIVQIAVQC